MSLNNLIGFSGGHLHRNCKTAIPTHARPMCADPCKNFVWYFFFLVLSRYMEWSVISDRPRLTTWLEKNKWHCWDLLLAHTNRDNSVAASCVHPNRSPGLTRRITWLHYSIPYSRNWGNLLCLLVGYILWGKFKLLFELAGLAVS